MMITIHGLSPTTKYVDVKMMIKQECNIDDYILDNMVTTEDGTKKVRIGLANESEGIKLIKCLNGYHMPGNYVVKVSPVGKSAHSNNHGPSGQHGPSGPHGPGGPRGPSGQRGPGGQQGLMGQRGPGSEQGPGGRGPGAEHGPGGQHMPGGQRGVGGPRGPVGQRGPGGNHGPIGQRGPGGEHGPVVQRGPGGDHSQGVQRGPSGPNKAYVSGGHHSQAPIDNMRPSLWVSNNTSNQWAPNQSITSQTPQNATYNFGSEHQQNASSNYMPQNSSRPDVRHFDQGRQGPLPEQSYGGYQPKGGILPRPTDQRQNLRNIDIMEGSNQAPSSMHGLGGRFPPNQYQQDKPMTIMKENFQGPTPFNITIPDDTQPQYQHRGGPPQWNPQGQQSQPKPQMNKPYEDRKYAPVDQQRYAKDPQPETYKEYEKRRGYSPKSRDPMPRRVSPRREDMHREPSGRMSDMGPRRASPMRIEPSQRRGSPPGRRDDPHGRRYSPSKRSSPTVDRRNVAGRSSIRHESPHKRVSPNRRLVSPNRRDDRPRPPRYSPGRHHSDKIGDKFGKDTKDVKKVRPAYEPPAHAPNQAMYSGGFRSSNAHDNVQYAGSGMRQEQPSSWQRRIDGQTNPMKKHEDERRDSRMQINRERVPDQTDKRYSPSRKSRSPIRRDRSPIRRDRSPIRDRFKRNSPSPRSSYSPRRSWALEKRSSPDAPPPPVWPGHHSDRDLARPVRSNFPEKDEKPKHQPVWEGRSFKEEELRNRRPEDRQRAYDEAKIRVAREVMERQSMKNAGTSERYQPKFSPRNDYEENRDNYSRRDLLDRKPHADDFDLPRRPREEDRFDDYNRRKASPRHEMKVETPKDFDKDFEDIYNRTLQFKKRTEELRKSSSRKRDDFDDNRRHSEKIPGNERQRYEDRGKYREEDSSRQKREKAIEEITQKILDRSEDYKHVQGEQKRYILAELKQIVTKIVFEMFGDSDVSFIEIIIKYQARYNLKDEAKILQDAIRSLPKEYRAIKRHAPESADIPAKTNRVSPGADLKQETAARPKLADSHFNVELPPPAVVNMPCAGVTQTQAMGQSVVPMMVSAPFYQSFESFQHNLQQSLYIPEPQPVGPVAESAPASFNEQHEKDGHRLYLCKDDFETFTSGEADLLKDYLVSEMFQTTGKYQGWSPDFTFKGLQSLYRYEVVTKDEWSKNWLSNLDFSEFEYFNVLVYTEEELWYERAAIWLPGHSRVRNIEPFEKLKLQNKKLDGINIQKWKLVKKIVNGKGTRLYVDMPPSSARALEAHGMKLSYELQQVNVFSKAEAVDKNAFDAGLKEISTTDPSEIAIAIKNSPMPVFNNDVSLVKIILKGSKTLDIVQARKIKEVVIYNLFQYHKQNGQSRTDFVKYGLTQPNYFAILPLNRESKRWLMSCNLGKVNRQVVAVVGAEDANTLFVKMDVTVPYEKQLRPGHLTEKLKHSNQGVKNINFNMWRSVKMGNPKGNKVKYEVEIDMESLETLASMRYQLDYVDSSGLHAVCFKSEYSQTKLENLIKNHKAEMTDSYDVANMDLDSDSNASESDSADNIISLE